MEDKTVRPLLIRFKQEGAQEVVDKFSLLARLNGTNMNALLWEFINGYVDEYKHSLPSKK